jgi:hypothetical protein
MPTLEVGRPPHREVDQEFARLRLFSQRMFIVTIGHADPSDSTDPHSGLTRLALPWPELDQDLTRRPWQRFDGSSRSRIRTVRIGDDLMTESASGRWPTAAPQSGTALGDGSFTYGVRRRTTGPSGMVESRFPFSASGSRTQQGLGACGGVVDRPRTPKRTARSRRKDGARYSRDHLPLPTRVGVDTMSATHRAPRSRGARWGPTTQVGPVRGCRRYRSSFSPRSLHPRAHSRRPVA